MTGRYDALSLAAAHLGGTWPPAVAAAVSVLAASPYDPDRTAVVDALSGSYRPGYADLADAAVELADELTHPAHRPPLDRPGSAATYGSRAGA